MLKITYRTHGIRLTHVWFANEAQIENREYCKRTGDIVFLHGVNTSSRGGKLYTQQKTVIKDLNLSKDELFLTLGKHLRQYIKRSKKEDVVIIRILDSEYLKSNSEIISDIGKIYESSVAWVGDSTPLITNNN